MRDLNESLKKYSHLSHPVVSTIDAVEMSDSSNSFVPIFRYIVEHLEQRLITYREYELYIWLRTHANMFGITSVEVRSILSNLRHFKSVDNVTKVLRALRKNRYIYYANRKGHRGTFQVKFDFWLGEKGVIYRFDENNGGKYVRTSSVGRVDTNSDVRSELSDNSPRSDVELQSQNNSDVNHYPLGSLRGGNNDTEKEKKKEIDDLSNSNNEVTKQRKVTTFDFIGKTPEERRCKEIAMEVGDLYINFSLSILRDKKGGIDVLEEALTLFKEVRESYLRNNKTIKNSGALFNKLVRSIQLKNKYSSYE